MLWLHLLQNSHSIDRFCLQGHGSTLFPRRVRSGHIKSLSVRYCLHNRLSHLSVPIYKYRKVHFCRHSILYICFCRELWWLLRLFSTLCFGSPLFRRHLDRPFFFSITWEHINIYDYLWVKLRAKARSFTTHWIKKRVSV